jgi:NAD-dependent deacetylase
MMLHQDAGAARPQLAELLAAADRILVFTGAGISTASGIRDYRGPQGMWKTQAPVFYQDFMTDRAARVRYWEQKLGEHDAVAKARPNSVHQAVVRLERAGKIELVVTQNVDGLHAAAGTSAEHLVEIHGTNRLVECQRCGSRSDPDPHFRRFAEDHEPPECECGGYLKPATISFGQQLRAGDLDRSFDAAAGCDLVVSLGSTLAVTPAADVPLAAARRGVPYVVANRGETAHDHSPSVTLRIDGDVGEVFPGAVDDALAKGAGRP